jgi:hypothetical protein
VLGAAIVTARTKRRWMSQRFDEVKVKVEVMHVTF